MTEPVSSPAAQPLHQKVLRPIWFLLAVVFLFEAWLWHVLGQALTRLAALIPLAALKRTLARMLDRLPPPVVLLVFLIPLAIIEPLKFLGLLMITHHHVILGILAFVAAKMAGLGVTAFLFEITRTKLLSMRWFERFYQWVLRIRAMAHDFIAPYKLRIKAAVAPVKARMHEMLAAWRGQGNGFGFGRKLASLRNWARRSRGLT
jgi:hypothetical protein